MRKLKLFVAACALLLSAGVQAQKDVTSQYITNATLSNGTNGWTKTFTKNQQTSDPADAFSNSVRGNNTVGYASEAYAGWGSLIQTAYSMKQTITLPAGNYTLVSYSFFRQGDANDADHNSVSKAYLKAGSNSVLLKSLRSITASGYANSQAEGANAFDSKMYRNTLDFTIDADNTSIEIGIEGTFDEARSWCIVGQFELIDNGTAATMDAPFDVTGYITNPGFEYRDMTGWTQSPDGFFGTQSNNQGFKVGGWYAEKWQSSGALPEGKFSQTLTDLPAGYYKLTANLGGNGTYVDLNGKTANWTTDKDYTVGYVLAENEDLTITAGKTSEGTANWIHFDNFRLQFCGDVAAALTTLLGQVSNYNGKIPSAAYSALQTNVADYDQNYSDVDDLLNAIAAVQALYEAADELVDPYATAKTLLEQASSLATNYPNMASPIQLATIGLEGCTTAEQITTLNTNLTKALARFNEWIELKAKADVLVAVANDNDEANATLADVINEQETNVQAVNAISEENLTIVNNAISKLKSEMTTYVGAANPVGDNAKFDCTFMLTNPDLTSYWDGTWWIQPAGWAKDQTDGNFQVMQNNDVNATDGIHKIFMEYYYLNNNVTYDNGQFNIYTSATLPAGTFSMSCYAFAKEQNYSSGNPKAAVYFYANDTQGSLVDASTLTEQTISFVNDAEQEVKIGLKPLAGNTYNWMGIGYVQLFKVPAKTYTVNENDAWDNTINGAGDVTLKRTIKEGVNTLVLPFSMTQTEVENTFGEGSKVYTIKSYNATTDNLSFETHDGISANKPCLLKATEASNGAGTYTLEGRTIVAGEPTDAVNGASMIGTYDASIYVPTDGKSYIINGGNIYKVTSDVTLKNTRAFIQLATATARALTVNFDGGETTGIATLENGELKIETGVIYDLSGRRVTTLSKGIYVINGKKVVK